MRPSSVSSTRDTTATAPHDRMRIILAMVLGNSAPQPEQAERDCKSNGQDAAPDWTRACKNPVLSEPSYTIVLSTTLPCFAETVLAGKRFASTFRFRRVSLETGSG